ncbi:DUF3667 domain-containing protein [Rugamonas sp.]|uniref:DUF3667 domain-containing protein n=1 Tax=Rugamonas sp. TaxID=1926287 RepID=UPI0025E9E358|nr:DUF3667 domain-containing protein [Rugamonas sp.]
MNPELQADDPHPAPAHCLNCGSASSGNYCAHCGQETVLHRPSALEFLHEFVGHYVALEGKLTGTLGRLLFRPGALTVEYLAGRRVRFVQPLRLYLTLSVLFFALMKFSGASLQDNDLDSTPAHKAAPELHQPAAGAPPAPIAKAAPAASGPAQQGRAAASAAAEAADDDKGLEIGVGKMAWLTRVWPSAASTLEHFNGLPGKEKNQLINEGFYHLAPTAMFCLMPLFALYLKLLYLGHGHRYGEHLLFALHTNAFAFAIFICMRVCNIGLVSFVLWVWLLGYLPWAMRRVYGLRRFSTAWRWLLLMFVYSVTMALALALMMTVTAGVLTAGH